jgi:O-methyltransferase
MRRILNLLRQRMDAPDPVERVPCAPHAPPEPFTAPAGFSLAPAPPGEVVEHHASQAPTAQDFAALRARVSRLEHRLLGYYTHRWNAIDMVADYLVGAQLEGDYLEFGVYEGRTFAYACRMMAPLFPAMRFVALDSFEGLPEPRDIDAHDGYTSSFTAGQFSCSEEQFRQNLQVAGVPLERVRTVKGWFAESLRPGRPTEAKISAVAAAWIDCDLYESTVPVLEFLTPRIQIGTVLLFDDWHCFRNRSDRGEQRACAEWLERNPAVKLKPFISFGFHGQAFTVSAR